MFNNYYHTKKDLVIVPKNPDKNDLKNISKVGIKPNNNNKTYENIRSIVIDDKKDVDINSVSKPNVKNNFKNNIV